MGYAAVTSPSVENYTADPTVVPALLVTSPAAVCPPADIKVTVTYTEMPDAHVNIEFFDDLTQKPVPVANGFNPVLTGKPGSPVGLTATMVQAGIDITKYVYVSFNNIETFTVETQTITVHLSHKTVTDLVEVTRTIHYTGATPAVPDKADKVTWIRTVDAVTGVAGCTTADVGYPAVASPIVAGYTVDPVVVPAQSVAVPPATCPPSNTETTVTYTRIPDGSVSIVFIDDANGDQVAPKSGFVNLLFGQPGTPVVFSEDDARQGIDTTKYVYVSMDSVPTFTGDPQTITVHVAHKFISESVDTTRTITYNGAGSRTPTTVVQTVTWTKTTDLVTEVASCTSTAGSWPAVKSPFVAGYQPDLAEVPALALASTAQECTAKSADVTVTYSAILLKKVESGGQVVGWPVVPLVAGLLTSLVALSLFGVFMYRRKKRAVNNC